MIIRGKKVVAPEPFVEYSVNPPDWNVCDGTFLSGYGFTHVLAGQASDVHFHDSQEYWFILEGRAEARVGNLAEEVEVGDTVYTPIGVDHQIKALTDMTVLWMYGELQGEKRFGHLHEGDSRPVEPGPAKEPVMFRGRRVDSPLPHLAFGIGHTNGEATDGTFISGFGIDAYPKSASCDHHFHDSEEYWFILEGNALALVGDEVEEVTPTDVVYTPMGTKHQITGLTDIMRVLWIHGPLHGEKRAGHLHDNE